jgi:hypothetical protein
MQWLISGRLFEMRVIPDFHSVGIVINLTPHQACFETLEIDNEAPLLHVS